MLEGRGYWVLAGILIVFGALAVFSIGFPFLMLGIALVLLAHRRDQPKIFWPPLLGLISFFIGYALLAPLSCSASSSLSNPVGSTTCSNILGLDYSGSGDYNAPLWPAVVAGLIAGGAGVVTTRLLMRRR